MLRNVARTPPVVARRRDAAELPGLDRRPAARRARPRRRPRGPGADERARRPSASATTATSRTWPRTWVAELVEAQPGDLVLDLCAAPGGKATHLAGGQRASWWPPTCAAARAGLVAANAAGSAPPTSPSSWLTPPRRPLRAGRFDRVLLDAPCSGLGALRRRPDARWRIQEDDIDRLAVLQRDMLDRGRRAGAARRRARLQRLHPDRGRVDRPHRLPRAGHHCLGRGRPWRAVRRRRPAAAPGRGHRRHDRAPVPSSAVTNQSQPAAGLAAKVLTVSDGVVARHPRRPIGRGAGRAAPGRGLRRRRAPGHRRRHEQRGRTPSTSWSRSSPASS